MDEATSNLDTVTEAGVLDTVFSLDKEISCVVIAHRLSTIKSCDRIMVMDRGSIVETGTHEELLASRGLYYKLWGSQ